MAVCLLREGERRSTQPQSPETRRLPRVTVINRPVAAAPHWRGTLRARTPTHVCYSQPEREEVWRETFQRYAHAREMYSILRRTIKIIAPPVLVAKQRNMWAGQLLETKPSPREMDDKNTYFMLHHYSLPQT